jgi:hypothetical protein
MPDEPERPDKIAAVLKLFEVQGHHDLEEFLGRVIEAHHGRSNGAGGSSRHRFNLRRDLPLFQHLKHAAVCDALNTATFKDEVLVWVIMSRHLLCPPRIASDKNTRIVELIGVEPAQILK